MLEKLRQLREIHLRVYHDTVLYPYQEAISDAILEALIENFIVIRDATDKEIKKLRTVELPIEISRQAGKTTAVVLTLDFIMCYLGRIFKRRISIGVFAPQREQAKTDFDRLKEALYRSQEIWGSSSEAEKEFKEQSNSTTLVLPNGSSCYIFPVSPTSSPESKTLDLIIFEESQGLEDRIIKEQIWPMGKTTNAPRVYVGTAGTQIKYFYRLGQNEGAIKLYFEDIVKQRRQIYEQTKNVAHLIYEQSVRNDIEKYGLESDEIQRPYFGKWLIGTGQFVTQEALDALMTERSFVIRYNEGWCYAGIDTAKHPDSTVVTILREKKDQPGKKELINWLELKGENYRNQFEIISEFIGAYKIKALAIDSTGQGEFMPDWFQMETKWRDELSGLYRVKFSAVSKDLMYKNLKVVIQESLTDLPKNNTRMSERFRSQMLDLQQEYKGQLLSVSHPNDPNAHDDYPDSWALAEWAYAQSNQQPTASVAVVNVTEKERKVKKNNEGKVTDYWPNQDW